MNSRSNNGASLPYFGNVSSGRWQGGNNGNNTNSNSNSNNGVSNTRRLSPAKFLVFLGLCVVSLLALSRIFTPAIDGPIDKPGQMEEPADDMEQRQIVQQILDSRKSSYSFDDFTAEGLAKPDNEHLLPTTAVLLGWKRIDGLKLIVNYLARYPYIKQIIVWNNNRDIKLSKRDFVFDSQYGPRPELQVYNAAENLHDIAKYMSCSLAKYKHCYIQDDDWLNTHMDALYTNFLTSPGLLHTNTQPLIQMEHRRWTFTNENCDMHTGFSWLGTGSYIPQEKAQRLLTQRGNSTLSMDRSKVIDMYFSIWTNQYPYQLVNYLTELDQKKEWSNEEVDSHWSTVFINMLDAADRLYSALVGNFEVTDKDYFARTQERPYVEDRHARSPCHNDRCLFMTSIDPFPAPKEIVFKGDIMTIDEQNAKFLELDYPTNQFWATLSYVHAVDNDPLTCWNSFKIPQAGDSFGLRFVKPTLLKYLTVTSSKSLTSLEGQITVLVSDRKGEHWTTCTHTIKYPFVHTMTLDIICPSAGPTDSSGLVDIVKIQFDNALEKSLEICGMDASGMIL
ncbi:hypothetical protein BG005_000520 [Podila minutissima]|nr:hypothetical protein BG005_000520 [Podila minutissima]